MNANTQLLLARWWAEYDGQEVTGHQPRVDVAEADRLEIVQALYDRLREAYGEWQYCHWSHCAAYALGCLRSVEEYGWTGEWTRPPKVYPTDGTYQPAIDLFIVCEEAGDIYDTVLVCNEGVWSYSSLGDEIEQAEREYAEENNAHRCGYCGEWSEIKTEAWEDTLCSHCGRECGSGEHLPDGVCAYYVAGWRVDVHKGLLDKPLSSISAKPIVNAVMDAMGVRLPRPVWLASLPIDAEDSTLEDLLDEYGEQA